MFQSGRHRGHVGSQEKYDVKYHQVPSSDEEEGTTPEAIKVEFSGEEVIYDGEKISLSDFCELISNEFYDIYESHKKFLESEQVDELFNRIGLDKEDISNKLKEIEVNCLLLKNIQSIEQLHNQIKLTKENFETLNQLLVQAPGLENITYQSEFGDYTAYHLLSAQKHCIEIHLTELDMYLTDTEVIGDSLNLNYMMGGN